MESSFVNGFVDELEKIASGRVRRFVKRLFSRKPKEPTKTIPMPTSKKDLSRALESRSTRIEI